MKYSELENKSMDELKSLLEENIVKLGKLQFDHQQNTLKDVSQLKKIKLSIARIKTAMKKAK